MADNGCWLMEIKPLANVLKLIKLLLVVFGSIIRSVFRWAVPPDCKSIRDDIVLVTGGGKGLGKRLVVEFAKHQPKHIVICGREKESLDDVADMINANGIKCTAIICDVSSSENIYAMAKQIKEQIGQVTILVNNAGVVYGLSVLESKDDEIVDAVNVNTLSHVWTLKAFLPAMLSMNRGHIVSINSMIGLIGLSGAPEYCSSKFASIGVMESLVQELSQELAATDIQVTVAHPYKLNNPMFKGCESRFPRLFPSLDESEVAKRIVHAVLTNQKFLILPRLMYLFWWMHTWLPTDATLALMRFTGVDQSMNGFYRRSKSH